MTNRNNPYSDSLTKGKTKHYVITVIEISSGDTVLTTYVDESTDIKAKRSALALPDLKDYIGDRNHRISMRQNPITLQDW